MASKKGKIFCVTSAKGGVGKTTIALSLAGVYQKLNKKVLLIDYDLYSGGIAVALNKPINKTIYDLYFDITNNNFNSLKDYTVSYNEFIDFIACPLDPRQASKIDSSCINTIFSLSAYEYDIVIVDTTHVISNVNLSIYEKVDNILFVTTNDPYDLKNLRSLISIFTDSGITNYKVLLNYGREPFKNYFSLYDIKNLLKSNIDYTLSPSFYLKNIDDYVIDGKIITLEKKVERYFAKDYSVLVTIATDFANKEVEDNEA